MPLPLFLCFLAYDTLSGHIPVSLVFALSTEKVHVFPTFIPHGSEQHRLWSGLSPLSRGEGDLLLTLPGNTCSPQVPPARVLVATELGWGQSGQQPTFLQEVQKQPHQLLQDELQMSLLSLKFSLCLPSITSSIGHTCCNTCVTLERK